MNEWKLYKNEKPELKENPEYKGIFQSDLILAYNKRCGIVVGRFIKAKSIKLHFNVKPANDYCQGMRPTHWMHINKPTK